MRFARLTSCALALSCFAASASAQELPADVTQALGEYAAKRADVMRRADAELAKHKQSLLKKIEKAQQTHKADVGDVPKQIDELMMKIKAPSFTSFELENVLHKNATTIDTATASQIDRTYFMKQMTEQQWLQLPAVPYDLKCNHNLNTTLAAAAGDIFVICPHPTQQWKVHKDSPWLTWDRGNSFIRAYIQHVDGSEEHELPKSVIVKTRTAGSLVLGNAASPDRSPEGFIQVKVFRVRDR